MPDGFLTTLAQGSPIAIVALILGYLLKFYIDNRREKREDSKTERESESGIVETTNAALKIVREQMLNLGVDMKSLRDELETKTRKISQLEDRVRELERENATLRSPS
jgi:predicted RNase H-like nuclease (RuvC/YqgF family)